MGSEFADPSHIPGLAADRPAPPVLGYRDSSPWNSNYVPMKGQVFASRIRHSRTAVGRLCRSGRKNPPQTEGPHQCDFPCFASETDHMPEDILRRNREKWTARTTTTPAFLMTKRIFTSATARSRRLAKPPLDIHHKWRSTCVCGGPATADEVLSQVREGAMGKPMGDEPQE